MVNWIAGHTDRFKALVSHAGVFNLENMYGATEEIWFTEWEFGGPSGKKASSTTASGRRTSSPRTSRRRRWSSTARSIFASRITRGCRCSPPCSAQGVPSRFVFFPDEGHWIGKPQNSRLWYGEVLGWLSKYLGGKVTS